MTNATFKYLGRDYTYPVRVAKELVNDWVINLHNYEIRQQGWVQCYSNTARYHFLILPAELALLTQLQNPKT